MARVLFITGMAVASTAQQVRAHDWSMSANALASGGYDDNVRLTADNELTSWTGTGDAAAQLQYRDDTFQWQLQPRLRAVRYADAPDLNRREAYLTMPTSIIGERSATSLTLNFLQDTTLTSELGLTGFANVNKDHRSGAALLSQQFSASQRLQVHAQLRAAADRYIDAERTGLVDYDYGSLQVGSSYKWSERSTISLQADAGKLRVPGIRLLDKSNYSVTVGYSLQLTPELRITLSGGPSRIATERFDDDGAVYDLSLSHQSELLKLTLAATSDITPTGQGLLTRRQQLRFGLNKAFTPRWSTNWGVAAIRTDTRDLLGSGQLRAKLTYATASADLTWSITPTWSTSLSAGYTLQRIGIQPQAERQQAVLNVSWNGLTRRML